MRHLFDCWNEVVGRLRNAGRIALFLDFDGTLTPARPRPQQAILHPDARRALAMLAINPRFRVGIISSRKRADILELVRVPRVRYLGLHGWDRGNAVLSEQSRSLMECVKSMLGGALANNPGAWIEDKDQTIAVHFRDGQTGVPPHALDLETRRILRQAIGKFDRSLRLIDGKSTCEIVPREIGDKGVAARKELTAACCRATPIYAGDDLNDEPAFGALENGITIYVGLVRPTRARFRLADAGEVRLFLEKLHAGFA